MIGEDLNGNLRRAATMWRIQQACKDGELPFSAEEVENSNGNSHLLLIISAACQAHVVRTESSGAFPKDQPIRQDSRLTNSPTLFDPKIVPFKELLKSVSTSYAWLMFKATDIGELSHVCWGMPKAGVNEYLAHVDILKHAQSIGMPIGISTPPKPNPADKIKFTRQLEEKMDRRKKPDGEKKA